MFPFTVLPQALKQWACPTMVWDLQTVSPTYLSSM
jgi:hypothetical protein